jgi:hypothetical protein
MNDTAALPLEDSKPAVLTAADINKMLWKKFTDRGEYVVLFDVPNVIGYKQERRCDAIAIGMWQSTQRLIHGFEIKVSRADWLREVRDVSKADPFIEQCDRWWLVTADLAIAKSGEIPESWGWLTATKSGLRIQRPPKPLPQDQATIKRLWAFALIRRAAESRDDRLQRAMEAYRDEIDKRTEERLKNAEARAMPALSELKRRVEEFEKASGINLEDWRIGNVRALARRLRSIGDFGSFGRTLDRQIEELQRLMKNIAQVREAVATPALEGGDDD